MPAVRQRTVYPTGVLNTSEYRSTGITMSAISTGNSAVWQVRAMVSTVPPGCCASAASAEAGLGGRAWHVGEDWVGLVRHGESIRKGKLSVCGNRSQIHFSAGCNAAAPLGRLFLLPALRSGSPGRRWPRCRERARRVKPPGLRAASRSFHGYDCSSGLSQFRHQRFDHSDNL